VQHRVQAKKTGYLNPLPRLVAVSSNDQRIVFSLISDVVEGTDADEDGLLDEWEFLNGLDAGSSEGDNGTEGDPDEDGSSNYDEMIAGTNPQDGASCFKVDGTGIIEQSETVFVVQWASVPGRQYMVQYVERMGETWHSVSGVITATGDVTTYHDTSWRLYQAQFYRVLVFP